MGKREKNAALTIGHDIPYADTVFNRLLWSHFIHIKLNYITLN